MGARLAIGLGGRIEIGRRPSTALEHLRDRGAHGLKRIGLRNIARRAEFHAMADYGAVFISRNDDDRSRGTLRTQEQESGKASDPRHGQIEQNEIGVGRGFKRRGHAVEIVRNRDLGVRGRREHRLTQPADDERVVIGNEDAKGAPLAHRFLQRAGATIADLTIVVTP
jgi:hypothetical protein